MGITEIHPTLPEHRTGIKKEITCEDGFTMSVQASRYHYSLPREDEGPHHAFEIGFPSEPEELIIRFAEDASSPTETVYGYVPAEVVDAVIAKHGGIKEPNGWAGS